MTDPKNPTNTDTTAERPPADNPASATEALREKLIDAQKPGYQAEFSSEEAERAGAFVEDTLSEQAAAKSGDDLAAALVAEGVDLDALASYGVDLLAALSSQRGDRPGLTIDTGEQEVAILGSMDMPHIRIHTANVSTLFGWKPGETLDEAIARTKKEEAAHAGAFEEDALSEQGAAESDDDQATLAPQSDDQTQAFITEGESLDEAIIPT